MCQDNMALKMPVGSNNTNNSETTSKKSQGEGETQSLIHNLEPIKQKEVLGKITSSKE